MRNIVFGILSGSYDSNILDNLNLFDRTIPLEKIMDAIDLAGAALARCDRDRQSQIERLVLQQITRERGFACTGG